MGLQLEVQQAPAAKRPRRASRRWPEHQRGRTKVWRRTERAAESPRRAGAMEPVPPVARLPLWRRWPRGRRHARRRQSRSSRAARRRPPSRPLERGSGRSSRRAVREPRCRPCRWRSRTAARHVRRSRFLSHFVIVPSTTVSPSCGIVTGVSKATSFVTSCGAACRRATASPRRRLRTGSGAGG